ncbi:MAG: hypothetical protein HOP33_06160 [Verrucomicrobia bacterium]|nr:hypothetical protein [Verrucomicrobiota bacterium]
MKTQTLLTVAVTTVALFFAQLASAVTNVFFNALQTATVVSSNVTAVTLRSGDYLFAYTVDGYWAVCPGCTATGRFFSVFWPDGIQAQAVTTGPSVGIGANITIKRVDGKLFDMRAFTGKLLANTAGTGGAFEIMPQLNGEDALNDPLMFDCSGYGGQSFQHTPMLASYDTYKIHLWVDWALTALTLIDTNASTSVTITNTITVNVSPAGAGSVTGAGNYPGNSTCTLIVAVNPGWGFQNWTENGAQISASPSYVLAVSSNRTLIASFVPLPPNLSVARSATNSLVLSWPANGIPFVLQENPSAGNTGWSDSSTPITVVGANNQAVITPLSGIRFFRLKLP